MQRLELQDILTWEDFEPQRKHFFENHVRYLEKYRKVKLGNSISLIFENRQTLWFRVQEIFRLTKISDPKIIQNELNIYNRLIPDTNTLQAALLIDPTLISSSTANPDFPLKNFRGDSLRFILGRQGIPSDLVTKRAEDLSFGNSLWVRFQLDEGARLVLKECKLPAKFQIESNHFKAESHNLPAEIRKSLWDDLQ